ncbi:hypothetical protein EB118_06980 [bacterium]|nr:hypothetical protein [bacterium]NDC94388.1 hypothetical protein [bacterium]NDD83929.1 hypothetical protein [bacterium]NDG29824.1 hypothetical protein [bacterium]
MRFHFLCFLIPLVGSHIMMKSPPSRRSMYSSYYVSNGLVDYNLRSPLNSAPFTFPCKGFPKGPSTQNVIGQVVVTLEGTAIHGGGHCQFGVSFDDRTFVVLETIVRNCLLTGMSYPIDIPSSIGTGPVTLFWTWINAIGNREYYMECADIYVSGSGSGTVSGLELLVVNLPGYPTIGEFGSPGMYDGSDKLSSRKSITVTQSNVLDQISTPTVLVPISTLVPIATPTVLVPISTPTVLAHTTIPVRRTHATRTQAISTLPDNTTMSEKCGDAMQFRCNALGGFDTCVYGKWVSRDCAPGTRCEILGLLVICNRISN